MNYRELKAELEKLTEEQLNQEVMFLEDDVPAKSVTLWILEEDFVDISGEGMEEVSVYADDEDYQDDDGYFDYDNPEILAVWKKGMVFLEHDDRTSQKEANHE
jgi:hypothetical protein